VEGLEVGIPCFGLDAIDGVAVLIRDWMRRQP